MTQEHPSGNSNVEHRTDPNHLPQAEEVTTSGPTPNRFWRMMTNPGFSPPVSSPASFVVTAKTFLGLTNQVQALAGMVQTIVPYLLQVTVGNPLISSSNDTPQMESPVASNQEVQLEAEVPQHWTESLRGFPDYCTRTVTKPLSRSGSS
ncbi:hypothetical protein B296_00049891 [Ensete ventricosum]|uniref:Uncharacterized protein n=1 Tax=Ensete ventricosum TaxID=4639 RepID=A0A426X2B3_ENSVE|nr:hypothetical protein B296_00049891 [Ensete ventricosum]